MLLSPPSHAYFVGALCMLLPACPGTQLHSRGSTLMLPGGFSLLQHVLGVLLEVKW